jgi:RNA polymerase sigma factor (sigma-70 family)
MGNYADVMDRDVHAAINAEGIGWAAALEEHARWLRTVILARTGDPSVVDDILQELAVAALKQPAGKLHEVQSGPWLYRLAVTQSLLHLRRLGRRRRLLQRFTQMRSCGDADGVDPGEWLLAMEQRQSVRAALETLAPKDREILLLKYSEDWSYRQLAERIGISESAVEARLHRARQRLRAVLIRSAMIEVNA